MVVAHEAQFRQHAIGGQRRGHPVEHRPGRAARVLRVQRHHHQPFDARAQQPLDRGGDVRLAVAHAELDPCPGRLEGATETLGEPARIKEQRRARLRPDRAVQPRRLPRPERQDRSREQRQPVPRAGLDHAPVTEEGPEVATDRPVARRVGRTQVHEQHAHCRCLPRGRRRRATKPGHVLSRSRPRRGAGRHDTEGRRQRGRGRQ